MKKIVVSGEGDGRLNEKSTTPDMENWGEYEV